MLLSLFSFYSVYLYYVDHLYYIGNSLLPVSQVGPSNPLGHVHMKLFPSAEQEAPLRQGLLAHGSMIATIKKQKQEYRLQAT